MEVKCKYCNGIIPFNKNICPHCGRERININSKSNEPLFKTNVKSNDKFEKNFFVAGIIAFIFGVYGIHNFYLGDYKKGFYHILLMTVGSLFIIGPALSGIWAFFEGLQLIMGSYNTK